MFRYSKSNGSLLKDLVSAILLLLAGLAVLLFPIYFDTYNRAASLGRIYVEEHTEIIAADALAMAIDLNRELSGADVIDDRIVETQTALRSLSVGLLLRQDGTIVARHSPGPDLTEQQLDRYIAEAREVVSKATEVTEDAVICIVKLDIAVADYLLVGRFINEDAIADWRRIQNLVGGPHQSFLFWVVLAVLALLIASTLGFGGLLRDHLGASRRT